MLLLVIGYVSGLVDAPPHLLHTPSMTTSYTSHITHAPPYFYFHLLSLLFFFSKKTKIFENYKNINIVKYVGIKLVLVKFTS